MPVFDDHPVVLAWRMYIDFYSEILSNDEKILEERYHYAGFR